MIDSDGNPSSKVADIKQYLQKYQLHIMGIIESDIHAFTSRIKRRTPLSTQDIYDKLRIDGYQIVLPQSWYLHGQARLLLYIMNDINFIEKSFLFQMQTSHQLVLNYG